MRQKQQRANYLIRGGERVSRRRAYEDTGTSCSTQCRFAREVLSGGVLTASALRNTSPNETCPVMTA